VEWANSAQKRLQGKIVGVHADLFNQDQDIDVVSRQEAYDCPSDTYQGTMVSNVAYSGTGQEADYFPLSEGSIKDRAAGLYGTPSKWIPKGKKILLARVATTGKLRVTYCQALPTLDKRRGKVSAVTLNAGTRQITALTLDASTFDETDATWLTDHAYITVVDKDGEIQMKAIPITAIDTATGVVTVDTFTYEEGEVIAVGDYVCGGKRATTHSQLPDNCEDYLLRTMTLKALHKDSSGDSKEWTAELVEMEDVIVTGFAEQNQDVNYVPVTDGDYLDQE
jgi:hypothetical protein